MAEAHHTIKSVVNRTGLSAHVIRVWEKRYRAVKPDRTDTNRRRYSDDEVERLALLRDVTRGGHSIGAVAKLPVEKLRELASHAPASNGHAPAATRAPTSPTLLTECIAAVNRLDSPALEAALKRGSVELGAQGLLQRVIAPLAQAIGELWRNGTITAAHEHFASAVIRVFLGHATRSFSGAEGAPVVVVGTPSGQLHELGAMLAGASAANLGWNVTYLGASLPAAEIAGAARQNRARAVALSLVYPDDDARLESELVRLRELLPAEMSLLVGGRAMPAYREILEKIGALQIKDLDHLCATLDELRKPTRKSGR
ncbi:MAG TPA: MerR family transcriptional regulator [Verrucomicrobiota bacterium]|nr:transcriptional regulator [Verrucomicrobiales bacterium]HRI14675.1 MerR family transcriptional regulator [Verrucomicrobiota bacterium]